MKRWAEEGSAAAALARRRQASGGAKVTHAWEGPSTPLRDGAAVLEAERTVQDGASLVTLAWELGRLAPDASPAERGALEVLAFVAQWAAQDGRAQLALEEVRERADHFALEGDARKVLAGMLERRRIPGALRHLVGDGGNAALWLTDGGLAVQRLGRLAEKLDTLLRGIQARPAQAHPGAKVKTALREILAGPGIRPTAEQQLAILNAVHLPFTVISGGPGTGKTTVVVSLLRMLVRLGVPPVHIALAAPTGKAAHRLGAALRQAFSHGAPRGADAELVQGLPAPQTLHRLLGYSPSRDRFRHGAEQPLPAQVVVVDECSMLDLFLGYQLVSACGTDTQLVLLGDADQLPPVDPGAVFRALVPPLAAGEKAQPIQSYPWQALVQPRDGLDPVPEVRAKTNDRRLQVAVRLERSFRMDERNPAGRHILSCARAINAGDTEALSAGAAAPVRRGGPDALTFEGVERLEVDLTEREPTAFFRRWHDTYFRVPRRQEAARRSYRFDERGVIAGDRDALRELVDLSERERILCVTKGDEPWGAARANAWFHRRWTSRPGVEDLQAGEPVIILRNDYERMLFNGDQGVVAWVEREGEPSPRLRAVFPREDGFVAHDISKLRPVMNVCYAMTVHKAQGAEFDHVALLVPAVELPLLTRELLYTAVSRARRSVSIIGETSRLRTALSPRNLRGE